MQKLEDEPRIEFGNFVRSYDGLREEFTASVEGRRRFDAWKEGLTGYPMVDACIRCVKASGWLNFRMRAMLASFSAYHLWLHWREPAVWLGSHFLDFEPGIHFSQFQMQSGTSGINTVRIYSPAKQALEQDPDGEFIRRWVPELRAVPVSWLSRPEQMPAELQSRCGCLIGRDYPAPIVEHAAAVKEARDRIAAIRRRSGTQTEAKAVFARHGSRKKSATHRERKNRQPQLPGLDAAMEAAATSERGCG
jgi:deoxyribodipyrimidine photo-lyase